MKKKTLTYLLLVFLLAMGGCGKEAETTGINGAEEMQLETLEAETDETLEDKKGENLEAEKAKTTGSNKESSTPSTSSTNDRSSTTKPSSANSTSQSSSTPSTDSNTAGSNKPGTNSGTDINSTTSSSQTGSNSGSKPSTPSGSGSTDSTNASNPNSQTATHMACTWNDGSVTTAANCNSTGVKTYTCTICGKKKTEAIAKTSHNYVTESTSATCTTTGNTKKYCSICGNVQSETSIPATGHRYFEEMWYTATCTSNGYYNIGCRNCNYVEGVSVAPIAHDVVDTVIKESTCDTPSIVSHTCRICGFSTGPDTTENNYKPHVWVTNKEGITYCVNCTIAQ